ncbi:MAG: type II toxin-antitoxin system PemK/MazF family toxin, partial [Candidatus Hydrogenedentes bacterium]|nr:type II toxin-antitoxin system PemK/MazF family toxin [Candidatus Hydrogenedentota bacterium]
NERTGLCIVCPVTTTRHDYPFHVPIPEGAGVAGVVMVEQVKSIDFRARDATRIGKASDAVLDEVLSLLDACIY